MRNTLFAVALFAACGSNPPLVEVPPQEDPPTDVTVTADPPTVIVLPPVHVKVLPDAGTAIVDSGTPDEPDAGLPEVDAGSPEQPIQCTRGKGHKYGLYKNGTCQ